MILGSKYNATEGLLECGNLKKTWIVDRICFNPNQKSNMAKYYATIHLYEVIKQQIVNKESVLNKEMIDMLIIFGKTKETFGQLDIDMAGVEAMDIQFSELGMQDKHRSGAPPETKSGGTSQCLSQVDGRPTRTGGR